MRRYRTELSVVGIALMCICVCVVFIAKNIYILTFFGGYKFFNFLIEYKYKISY